jgi:DNA-binding transcriptional LysR family regulator
MKLHQIRYFLVLAETAHFSRAAIQCNVSQPSLSRAIRKLEDELGAPLFERRPGVVALTDFGRHLLPLLRCGFEQLSAIGQEAGSYITRRERHLRVGIMTTIFHKRFVCAFAKVSAEFPSITLHIDQAPAETLLGKLEAEDVDIAIICDDACAMSDDITVTPLYHEYYCLAFREEPVSAQDDMSADLPLLAAPESLCGFIRQGHERNSVAPFRYAVGSHCFAREMARRGLGIAVVPEFALIHGLTLKRIPNGCPPRRICVAHKRGRRQSKAAVTLMRLIKSINDWRADAEGAPLSQ